MSRSVQLTSWTYYGARVGVPFAADIPPKFRHDGTWRNAVQRVLNRVQPSKDGVLPAVVTCCLSDAAFYRLAASVPVGGIREWGVHAGHHARNPGLSPFVRLPYSTPCTSLFTVHLDGTVSKPLVVRAYPGEEIPPLPWMSSARSSLWRMSDITAYWRTHAYVLCPDGGPMRPGTQVTKPPAWFTR